MKKILFVINTLGMAGAEKALIEMLNRLDTPEYEVSLFVLMNQGELRSEIPPHVKLLNKNFDDCPIHGEEGASHLKKHVLSSLFKRGTIIKCLPYLISETFKMIGRGGIRADKLLWRAMAVSAERFEEKYDLAVAYIEGGAAYYVKNYVKADKKVGFIHIDYKEAGYTRSLDRNCYLSFDRIFTVSDEVKTVFESVYPELKEKTEVFHNLLNFDSIMSKADLPGGFDDDFGGIRLLSIGRLNLQKSFEVSIDAMMLLKEKGINARWYILGEGDQREFLENRINELDLAEDFILLGNKSNPYPYLKQCDIYVHASKFEGKSIAIQEARILGKPILVTDCSGNREQIDSGIDGLICDFNSEAIADSILEMLKDREKAADMGKKAAERIVREEKNSGEMQKFYKILM